LRRCDGFLVAKRKVGVIIAIFAVVVIVTIVRIVSVILIVGVVLVIIIFIIIPGISYAFTTTSIRNLRLSTRKSV
jgi:uncharacterized membrane protein YjgN (DUF898 family)